MRSLHHCCNGNATVPCALLIYCSCPQYKTVVAVWSRKNGFVYAVLSSSNISYWWQQYKRTQILMFSAPYCAVLMGVVVSSDFRKVLCESRYDICGQTYDGANRHVSLFGYFLSSPFTHNPFWDAVCVVVSLVTPHIPVILEDFNPVL